MKGLGQFAGVRRDGHEPKGSPKPARLSWPDLNQESCRGPNGLTPITLDEIEVISSVNSTAPCRKPSVLGLAERALLRRRFSVRGFPACRRL